MKTKTDYLGINPVTSLKAGDILPQQGIIFSLERQRYKNEAVGNVLFYDKGISEISIMEEELGGHITIHAPGNQIIFSIQNLENPDSEREPYNRQSGYIPISFNDLDVIPLMNNMRALIEQKPDFPPRNYSLSNWEVSFSRVFERNEIEALKLTIINAFNEKLEITKGDAEVISEKIINKLI